VLSVVAVLSATLLAVQVAWLAPFFVPDDRPATTPGFTLLSLNTLYGGADPDDLVRDAAQADVVVLLEATAPLVDALRARKWSQRFPYSVGVLETQVGDTLVFSRFPLSTPALLPTSQFQQWVATVAVPRLGAVRIIAAHPCNPYCPGEAFRTEHQELQDAALARMAEPLVIAGDLNAVDDHAPMRDLRRVGLESVTDIVGAGWLPTYPANRTIPPLLPIDHILLNHFLTATSVRRLHVRNTDHLGLLAQITGTG
jgi:endonuclease/exonuclease/phosphatase (EEP) superfamily protein YafD